MNSAKYSKIGTGVINFKKALLIGIALLCSTAVLAQNMIFWSDLQPKVSSTIQNPFATLSIEQRSKLLTIARFYDDLTNSKKTRDEAVIPKAVIDIEKELAEQGIDVESLMQVRQEIIKENIEIASQPNAEVLNKNQTIPGYVTPLEMDGTKVTKFFLVPTAGACIHTPPPPANQIIYVEFDEGVEFESLATPVTISGQLISEIKKQDVNYSDGAANVESVYSMSATAVEFL
ncbi:hypothetical protein BCT04_15225 [Vibrio breoganii]|uniref:DUF3299 domain-containing protein n=1 Tax=Vibrio breoganii TaxID=553239 RepID=UPI000CC07712|nr:DUF3299 domain-containing protein [Vibrio breoganii]PMO63700.1 hypothetical protein BCT04_15225 [Vibrio breoganii]